MAVSAQLAAALRIGGHYTSLVANQISWGNSVKDVDTTVFATVPFTTYAAGLKRFEVSTSAYNDYAVGGADEFVRAYIGTIQPFSLAPEGDLAGNLAVVGQGLLKSYKAFGGKVGDIAKLDPQPGGTGIVGEGKLSIDGATVRAATTTGTAVQLGAITAGHAVNAACHLTAFGGTITSVTFSLQSDTVGFPSPVTVATGSALTAVGSSWLSSSTVTADDYWRVVATVVGAAPSFVVAAAIAIV